MMSEEDSAENNTEEEDKNGNVSTNYSRTTDRSKVRATKDASQRVSPNVTSSRLKNGQVFLYSIVCCFNATVVADTELASWACHGRWH